MMETLNWFCFIAMPLCYAYLAVFAVRDTIIDKLTRLYIYTDKKFTDKSKYTRGDWDSLNHFDFIRRTPILFVLMKEGALLFGMPFMACLFSIFLFGIVPVKTEGESYVNLHIAEVTLALYYTFAVFVIIYHRISFRRYKQKAAMEKNLWEAKSILAQKR